MKFKGRNGGLAIAIRNHIMMMRCFIISSLLFLIPTIIFLCIHNPYFYVFLIMPLLFLALSFLVLLGIKYDEKVFLSEAKKDHVFEVTDNKIYKDKKEIKLFKHIKIYRYKGFLYMETSHSMFIIRDTEYILGNREEFISWAKDNEITVLSGY